MTLCLAPLGALLLGAQDPACTVEVLLATPPIVTPDPNTIAFGLALSTDGARLAASAPGEIAWLPDFSGFEFTGAVYVHRRENGAWVLEQKLLGPSDLAIKAFGWACDIDGDTLLVSAPSGCIQDCIHDFPPGEVLFYEFRAGAWELALRTFWSDPSPSDTFGGAVALDGDRAVVGALFTQKAYVFERVGGTWTEVAQLQGPPGAIEFGRNVGLDGDVIAVAAPFDTTSGVLARGAVYVYERGPAGWEQVAKLVSPLALDGSERFGDALALAGERLAVGSYGASFGIPFTPHVLHSGATACGAVMTYTRGDGSWPLEAILGSGLPQSGGEFGRAVALDGNELLVGSSPFQVGRAELFRRGALGWAPVARLDPPAGPSSVGGELGWSVALGGGMLAASAPGSIELGGFLAGSVVTAEVAALQCADQSLLGAPAHVRLSTGGTHVLSLDAGAAQAGSLYVVVGSATGTEPGVPLGSALVPLVVDAYTSMTVSFANVPPFLQTFGVLDGQGRASAAIAVPAGLSDEFAGLALHHAFAGFDLALGEFTFASSPATFTLLP